MRVAIFSTYPSFFYLGKKEGEAEFGGGGNKHFVSTGGGGEKGEEGESNLILNADCAVRERERVDTA